MEHFRSLWYTSTIPKFSKKTKNYGRRSQVV